MKEDNMKQGWEVKKLGEVFNLQMGKTPSRDNSNYWGGTNTWVAISDLQGKFIGTSKEHITDKAIADSKIKKVKAGTVIMSFKLSVGRAAITTEDLYTNEAIMAFNLNDAYELKSDYIYYYLKGYKWEGANKAVMGITLNKATISQNYIAIPPLPVQEQIVSELDLLSGIIEKKREQLKELDALAQSIFYDMFGDPITNEKGREVKKLGEVCDVINGFAFKSQLFTDEGDCILRISNIQDGYVDLSDVAHFNKADYPKIKFEKYAVLPNDIVIALSGATTGKLGINKTGHTLYLNQRVAICREKSEDIQRDYLLYYLHEQSQKFLSDAAGVAQPNLSTEQMKDYNMSIPPLHLQHQFATKIEAIEKQKELIKQSISETETLFNERMQRYFN